MAACEILDFGCIFINEIFGSVVLTVIAAVIFYLMIASKLRFGFDTTVAVGFPLLLISGLAFAGFSVIYAFATVVVAIMAALIFDRITGNR